MNKDNGEWMKSLHKRIHLNTNSIRKLTTTANSTLVQTENVEVESRILTK